MKRWSEDEVSEGMSADVKRWSEDEVSEGMSAGVRGVAEKAPNGPVKGHLLNVGFMTYGMMTVATL